MYVKPKEGRALVVGSRIYKVGHDRRKRYADVIGIDVAEADGVDYVANLEFDLPYYLGPFSHIDCVSVLAHSKHPWLLANNLQYLLRKGDTLFVDVPFVSRIHESRDDYWRISPAGLKSLFPDIEWLAIQFVPGYLEQENLEAIRQEKNTYFLKSEICAFGTRR